MTLVIVLNTLLLSTDHYPTSAYAARLLVFVARLLIHRARGRAVRFCSRLYESAAEILNFVFSLVFALELLLKLYGLGVRGYFRETFNWFDAIVVAVSLVDIANDPPVLISGGSANAGGGIGALRALRLFRVFRLARFAAGGRELSITMPVSLTCVGGCGGAAQELGLFSRASTDHLQDAEGRPVLWHFAGPLPLHFYPRWTAALCEPIPLRSIHGCAPLLMLCAASDVVAS